MSIRINYNDLSGQSKIFFQKINKTIIILISCGRHVLHLLDLFDCYIL